MDDTAVRAMQAGATVHRGFLSRSQGIPIESLYLHAHKQGLRLVLCGEEQTWVLGF
mgnify:CR=1 FL=1